MRKSAKKPEVQEPPPRGRGRPFKLEGAATVRIDLRAQPAEKAEFESAAARAGVKLSEWIRQMLLRAARRG
jgi:predicted HicB family RNase H-like nuclease